MRIPVALFLLSITLTSAAQTLFEEDFEGSPAFTLNTTDAGSGVSVWNTWVVNNSYSGGAGEVVCIGFPFGYTIVNTPAQPAGISNANGNYLHTASVEGIADGITCCSFGAADGLCIPADNTFSRMTSDVSTVGAAQVEFKFWWVCEGGASYYGQVYYSTNGGSSWAATGTPAQYNFQGSWTEQTISLLDFGNQATLRFGFRFVNSIGLGAVDPGFAVDDVRIIAIDAQPVSISAGISPLTYCQGTTANVECAITGTFTAGNVFSVELSDNTGSFASPTVIGALNNTIGGSIACTIPPGTLPGNGYRVRIASSSPATTSADNGADITVFAAPYAGENTSLTICTGDDPATLDTGGDPGGTWTGPSPVVNDLYDPATMNPGEYTWTVNGTGPCASASATITVIELPGANAGESTTATVCKNTGIYQLFEFLGGTPDVGGTWTGPGGSPSDGSFNSNTTNGGIYTYAVDGGGSCGTDEAVVSVIVGLPGEAGQDTSWTVCSSSMPVDLYDLLDMSADQDGIWFDGGLPFNGVAEMDGIYMYIDYADQPCVNDTATIDLVVAQEAYAGENGTVEVCAQDPPLALIDALGGAPQAGGIWTGPGGSPNSGIFIPGTSPFGLYTYTIPATEPCEDDEAVVAVVPCVGMHEQMAAVPMVWLGREVSGEQLFSMAPMPQATIEVMDASGRTVLAQANVTITGQLRVDTGMLGAGMYTLQVLTAEGLVRGVGGARVVRFVQ